MIARVREKDPAVYLRVVAGLVPAHVLVHEARLDELSDDELATYLIAVRQALGLKDQGMRDAASEAASETLRRALGEARSPASDMKDAAER